MATVVQTYSPTQIQQLAEELAEDYVGLLDVDIQGEEKYLEESIEETLAHLEEVFSVTDAYKQHHSEDLVRIDKLLSGKSIPLKVLCDEVDRLEQFMFEMNRLLDQLDECMKCLESKTKPRGGQLRQIIGLIPKFSRFGLLSNVSAFIDGASVLPSEDQNEASTSTQSTDEVLGRINEVTTSLLNMITELNNNPHGNSVLKDMSHFEDDLSVGRDEHQVDGSWQELL